MNARPQSNGTANKLAREDRPAHGWYRFVLSYPPHLVSDYADRFGLDSTQSVLDPFCGTGTTLVECKKLGLPSVGIEANPMAHFAAEVKLDWGVDPDELLEHAQRIADAARTQLKSQGISEGELFVSHELDTIRPADLHALPDEAQGLLLTNSISPLPLHKTLTLLGYIRQYEDRRLYRHELLALANTLVFSISNLRFGPEVGVGRIKDDAPVIEPWLAAIGTMAADLRTLRHKPPCSAVVYQADSRQMLSLLEPASIDAVITSPPYPNEKDYTRTTRLESVVLGFLNTKADLRGLKQGLMRSNTRNVYHTDDDDDWVKDYPEIQRIANEIEARRIALGKTSGFEKLYSRVTKLYFGGMVRHLAALRAYLRPNAQLAYVVGDQASYLKVMIRTGQILADIAQRLGYEVENIDLFRTRWATATKEQMREEVVLLRWSGGPTPATGSAHMPKKRTDKPAVKSGDEGQPMALFERRTSELIIPEKGLKQYDRIVEHIFRGLIGAAPTADRLAFTLKQIKEVATELDLPQQNYPDIKYTYGGRSALPKSILSHGNWAIVGAGKGKYEFVRLKRSPYVTIPQDLKTTRILDATPQIVLKYQGSDEQSQLARIRYNRLIDIFTSLTAYHLQTHLRTTVKGLGQVEMDDLYIGVDTDGTGYILPVEAKPEGRRDQLGVVQIAQMVKFARKQFPGLKVRPIGVKMLHGTFVFIEFNDTDDIDLLATERFKRYELVSEK